jgi:Tol biopolymer transport system component
MLFSRLHAGAAAGRIGLLKLREDGSAESEPLLLKIPDLADAPASNPQWLSGSGEVVFLSDKTGRGQVWRAKLGDSILGGVKPLIRVDGESRISGLKASARGHRLVFSQAAAGSDIWRVGLGHGDGAGPNVPERLIADTREQRYPQFSPDGNLIVFESTRSGTRKVWMARSDGSTPAALSSILTLTAGAARWSPNGQFVVFESSGGSQAEVMVAPALVGGSPRRLNIAGRTPDWSPDGANIYFSSDRTGRFEVWRIPAQGNASAQQITRSGGWAPVLSASGDTLYYQRSPGRSSSLWRMPAKGGPETLVADSVMERGFAPYDRGVYFLSAAAESAELRFVEPGGSPSTAQVLPGPIESGLSISKDGRWALFTRRSASADLMLLDGFR